MIKIIAMLASIGAHDVPRQEINCLAKAVWSESRGESTAGQMAVAHVIMNRVQNAEYPNTVCDVVYQPHQFSYIEQAVPDRNSEAWENAVRESIFAYTGYTIDVTAGATHFYAQDVVLPDWAKLEKTTAVIGGHTFKIVSKE